MLCVKQFCQNIGVEEDDIFAERGDLDYLLDENEVTGDEDHVLPPIWRVREQTWCKLKRWDGAIDVPAYILKMTLSFYVIVEY